jgi:type II secretory pathway component PulC
MLSRAILVLALPIACACGGEPKPSVTPARANAASATARPAMEAREPLPSTGIRRSAIRRALASGLGAVLQHVSLDERPVFAGGKFHGFRVAALAGDPAWWRGVDLRPGDVITRVNGLPIEHPEEALEAFRSLEVASELRIDFDRDGAPQVLRYAIVDDEPVRQADASVR